MSKKNKSELQSELKELQKEKEALLDAKKANPKAFTDEQQKKLSEVTEQVVDLEEQIELADDEPEPEKKGTGAGAKGTTEKEATGEVTNKPFCKIGYTPKPGTERLVHLKIVRKGNRYDSETGKEIVQPYVQTFTYGEYKNFEKNADLIGMKIEEVLYNPYKE